MDYKILEEYEDIRAEMKLVKQRKEKLQYQKERIERGDYIVSDTVTGTRKDGTIGPIKVEGIPSVEYQRVISKIRREAVRLSELEEELFEKLNYVQDFIYSIKDSKVRQILELKYLDNLTYSTIAANMNSRYHNKKFTADSCRMIVRRYLKGCDKNTD